MASKEKAPGATQSPTDKDGPAKKSCCGKDGICHTIMCYPLKMGVKLLFWVLAVVTSLIAVQMIIVACVNTAAVVAFNGEHTGNIVALVILAITGLVSIVISLTGAYHLCRDQGTNKSLRVSAIVLSVVLLLQVLIVSFVAIPSRAEQQSILRQLVISFNEAKTTPSVQRKWETTQNGFQCCGIFGAEDYRLPGQNIFFPPDISISCCPSYVPSVPSALQEREKEICKARRDYYMIGCKDPVLEVFDYTGTILVGFVASLVLLQIIEILVFCFAKRKSKEGTPPLPAETP